MNLGTKVLCGALGAILVTTGIGIFVQRSVVRGQGIEMQRQAMRSVVVEAECIRQSISELNKQQAFDAPRLIADAKKSTDLRSTTFYRTIPVVAAWNAIEKLAVDGGYEFRVPKRQARNPKNTPTSDEEKFSTRSRRTAATSTSRSTKPPINWCSRGRSRCRWTAWRATAIPRTV